jgi:hypothetical protein
MASVESEALLQHEDIDDHEQASIASRPAAPRRPSHNTNRQFYLSIATLMTCRTLYQFMAELPLVRLFERAICQAHYSPLPSPDHKVEESQCKVAAIQDRLAFVMGLKITFDAIPGA